jgi:hypothetical protein
MLILQQGGVKIYLKSHKKLQFYVEIVNNKVAQNKTHKMRQKEN